MSRGSQKDGGYAWVVVFAFFTSSIIIDAMRYAFGLLYVEFLSGFKQGKGVTGGIGSVLISSNNILGPVIAAGINRFGVRVSAIAGSVLGAIGLVTSSFANQIYPLYFTYGIIQGVGLGLMYLSGWVVLSRYFEKKRGKAIGIAQCGCGVGAFIISPLLKMFIDEYTWRGAMLILAGMCLNGCVLAMLYRPFEKSYVSSNDLTHEKNKVDNVLNNGTLSENKSFLSENERLESETKVIVESREEHSIDDTNRKITSSKLKRNLFRYSLCHRNTSEPSIPKQFLNKREEQLNIYEMSAHKTSLPGLSVASSSGGSVNSRYASNVVPVSDVKGVGDDVQNLNKDAENHKQFHLGVLEKFFPKRIVTEVKFVLLMLSALFYCMATFIPISLLPDYGRIVCCTDSEVVWFVSAIGIGGTMGRFLGGFVTDITCINRIWFLGAMLLILSVSTFLLSFLTSFILLIIFSFTYGICIGTLYIVPGVILMDLFSEELIPQAIGVRMYVAGVATIVGVPVAGWLFDTTQSYTASFLFCGGLFMCALITNVLILCVPNKHSSKQIDD